MQWGDFNWQRNIADKKACPWKYREQIKWKIESNLIIAQSKMEAEKIWNIKVRIMPIIAGTLGFASKTPESWLRELEIWRKVEIVQIARI